MDTSFDIEFAYEIGGYDSAAVALSIADRPSHTVLVDVRLTAEQFTKMMRGSLITNVEGVCSSYLDRVGKRMENESFRVPPDVLSYGSDQTALALEWASTQPWFDLWETHEAYCTNSGWKILVRRWVEAD